MISIKSANVCTINNSIFLLKELGLSNEHFKWKKFYNESFTMIKHDFITFLLLYNVLYCLLSHLVALVIYFLNIIVTQANMALNTAAILHFKSV